MLTVTITGNFSNPVECFDFFALLAKLGVSPTMVEEDRKAHPTDQVVNVEARGVALGGTTTGDENDNAQVAGEAPSSPFDETPKTGRGTGYKSRKKAQNAAVAAAQPADAATVPEAPTQTAPVGDDSSAIQTMRDKINQLIAGKKGAQVATLMGKYKAATVRDVAADQRAAWLADADKVLAGQPI